MLDEILDAWETASTDADIELVESEGGDHYSKAVRAGMLTFSSDLLPMDLAVRDWARRDCAVAERLRRVDNRRMDYLRSQFSTFCPDEEELEARCMMAFSVAIGNHFIVADHGNRTRAEVLELVTRRLLA